MTFLEGISLKLDELQTSIGTASGETSDRIVRQIGHTKTQELGLGIEPHTKIQRLDFGSGAGSTVSGGSILQLARWTGPPRY